MESEQGKYGSTAIMKLTNSHIRYGTDVWTPYCKYTTCMYMYVYKPYMYTCMHFRLVQSNEQGKKVINIIHRRGNRN